MSQSIILDYVYFVVQSSGIQMFHSIDYKICDMADPYGK